MKSSTMWSTVIFVISLVTVTSRKICLAAPTSAETIFDDDESEAVNRGNLEAAEQEAFNSSKSQTLPVQVITSTETLNIEVTTLPSAPAPSSTQTQEPSIPKVEAQIPQRQVINQVTLQNLQPGENLFNGLAVSVGQGSLGGIIMEAFKVAQVAIALFGQSLVGQFAGPIYVISNSTKLVGV